MKLDIIKDKLINSFCATFSRFILNFEINARESLDEILNFNFLSVREIFINAH